jgi:ketol-acid reductoisomerase
VATATTIKYIPERIVQQNHIAVGVGGAGQADALLLPAAEVDALLACRSQGYSYNNSTKQNSEEHIVTILCVDLLYTLPEKAV